MTPRSNGVCLNSKEIETALHLHHNHIAKGASLESVADLYGLKFYWIESEWPDKHGFYVKSNGVREIWIPRSTPFYECCTFGHEVHHALFAPDKECWKEMDRIEIAKWEGKATAFGALLAMPQLHFGDADMIRRAYGPSFEHYAHYRVQHFQHHGF